MKVIHSDLVVRWLQQARKLHKEHPHEPFTLRRIMVVATLFYTGARCQEVCNLEQNDVVATDRMIQFYYRTLKHGDTRIIPVANRHFSLEIDRYREAWPASARAPFISTIDGTRPYPRLVHRIIKAAFPDFSPHSFRHHYASLLASEGVDMTVIQHCLGHRYLNTTAIYLQRLSTLQTSKIWSKIDGQIEQHDLF